jgi:hypothetical protein
LRRRGLTAALLVTVLTVLPGVTSAYGQAAVEPPKAARPSPVERADDLRSKATVSGYFLPGDQELDLNVRHRFADLVTWVGLFVDRHGKGQGRVGAEYDFSKGPLLVIPTLNLGSNELAAGSVYFEAGKRFYGIGGYAVTNGKPFYNLSFDPNDSVELGAGWHVSSYDRLAAFTIFDVRFHTGQQDTHVLWRHKLDPREGITVDALYKSGRGDAGQHIEGLGLALYYDRARFFVKAAWDPHVNFSPVDMLRVGAGIKF